MTNRLPSFARLRQERSLLQRLLSLALEQRDSLISGATDRLAEIVAQQGALLQRLSRVAAGGPASDTNQDAPETAEDSQLRAEIADLARQLQSQARLNAKLAGQAMSYIDFSMSLLCGKPQATSYTPAGNSNSACHPLLMSKTA
jgi:transposase